MALSNNPVFVQTPIITPITIVNATGTSAVTAATAGANGSKVTCLILNSTDTVSRTIYIYLARSGTNYLIGSVPVPAGAGNDGATAVVDVMGNILIPGIPIDNDGQRYLLLDSGDTLQIASGTAVTSGKTITGICQMGNF